MCLLLSKGSKQAMKKLAIVNACYVCLSCQILVMIFLLLDSHLVSCCYMQRHFVILDRYIWRGRLGEDGSFPSLQDCSPSDSFPWDAEDRTELTALLQQQTLMKASLSLCGMVSVQARSGAYWGSASVLNGLSAEVLQDKNQNAAQRCSAAWAAARAGAGRARHPGGEEVSTLLALV